MSQKQIVEYPQMEKITTFQGPRGSRASLDTMPLEILNDIFLLASSEDLDLSLLHVSRQMRWKLLDHPISKTVRAFWPFDQHTQLVASLTKSSVPLPPECVTPCGLIGTSDRSEMIREEVLASAWCTPSFLRRMQVAFIRRVVKEYWDPFLERDGLKKCATTHAHFWDLLDRVAYSDLGTEEKNMEICLADNETRYSWTRIRIWPWQGRIVIRDQLLNRSLDKTLPFLQCILIDKV